MPTLHTCECGRKIALCSDWLSCELAMEIYNTSEATVRDVLPKMGIPAGYVPGLGWRINGPAIEKFIETMITNPGLAREMQEERRTLRTRTKRRNAHATQGP